MHGYKRNRGRHCVSEGAVHYTGWGCGIKAGLHLDVVGHVIVRSFPAVLPLVAGLDMCVCVARYAGMDGVCGGTFLKWLAACVHIRLRLLHIQLKSIDSTCFDDCFVYSCSGRTSGFLNDLCTPAAH